MALSKIPGDFTRPSILLKTRPLIILDFDEEFIEKLEFHNAVSEGIIFSAQIRPAFKFGDVFFAGEILASLHGHIDSDACDVIERAIVSGVFIRLDAGILRYVPLHHFENPPVKPVLPRIQHAPRDGIVRYEYEPHTSYTECGVEISQLRSFSVGDFRASVQDTEKVIKGGDKIFLIREFYQHGSLVNRGQPLYYYFFEKPTVKQIESFVRSQGAEKQSEETERTTTELEELSLKVDRIPELIAAAIAKTVSVEPPNPAISKANRMEKIYLEYGTRIAAMRADKTLDEIVRKEAIEGFQDAMEDEIKNLERRLDD